MSDRHDDNGHRVLVNLRLKYADVETFVEKSTKIVNRTSIFLPIKKSIPVGTRVRFKCQLSDGTTVVEGDGTVAWVVEADPAQPRRLPGVGVKFGQLDPVSRQVIDEILVRKERELASTGQGDAAETRAGQPEPKPPEPREQPRPAEVPPPLPRAADAPPPLPRAADAPPQKEDPPSPSPPAGRPESTEEGLPSSPAAERRRRDGLVTLDSIPAWGEPNGEAPEQQELVAAAPVPETAGRPALPPLPAPLPARIRDEAQDRPTSASGPAPTSEETVDAGSLFREVESLIDEAEKDLVEADLPAAPAGWGANGLDRPTPAPLDEQASRSSVSVEVVAAPGLDPAVLFADDEPPRPAEPAAEPAASREPADESAAQPVVASAARPKAASAPRRRAEPRAEPEDEPKVPTRRRSTLLIAAIVTVVVVDAALGVYVLATRSLAPSSGSATEPAGLDAGGARPEPAADGAQGPAVVVGAPEDARPEGAPRSVDGGDAAFGPDAARPDVEALGAPPAPVPAARAEPGAEGRLSGRRPAGAPPRPQRETDAGQAAPSDAGQAEAASPAAAGPPPDSGSSSPRDTAGGDEQAYGFLTFSTVPSCEVVLAGRVLGTTPLVHVRVPAGQHVLTLRRSGGGAARPYPVTIRPGETLSRRVVLD